MEEEKTIDVAISSLEQQIERHQNASRKILFYVMYIVSFLLVFGVALFVYEDYRSASLESTLQSGAWSGPIPQTSNPPNTEAEPKQESSTTPDSGAFGVGASFGGGGSTPNTTILYVFVAVFVVVFGVMMAIYRFHLSEISRSEQLKVGFMRIRIAANNYQNEGFSTEVRTALTADAFTYQTGKDKKIESPLPGHPSSDVGTLLVNKLIDNVELNLKSKDIA